jgi:hypothetical protein
MRPSILNPQSSILNPQSSILPPAMPRFVLLTHDHPFVHWDFLMESPARWLSDLQVVLAAESIAAHRLNYLDYEGPVSRERGRVVRWDHGVAEWLAESESSVRMRLSGKRLVGELVLDRHASQPLWSARFSPSVLA